MACIGCGTASTLSTKNNSVSVTETQSNSCNKMNTFDWLNNIPENPYDSDIIEVRFKNTRKEYYINSMNIPLNRNDIVSLEALTGHDVGIVSLKGNLAEKQWKRKVANGDRNNLKAIYRKATPSDVHIWLEAQLLENATMLKARQIATALGLEMKISDVEYQGDKRKTTFYYIAEQRIDYRELIKLYAEEFRVKIEMKQIGVRQEAGRIGGIGSCGRELCCSTWRTELPSVSQSLVLKQNLTPNAEKYLGQCGKLKCCLTYELESYLEAKEEFPKELLELETKYGIAHPFKIDLLKRTVWYSYKIGSIETHTEVALNSVKEYILQNKKGVKIEKLE
jgi:cell fate regulator YaaT (PSP1 superfamily)